MNEHEDVAKRGGSVAKEAKLKLEAETGKDCKQTKCQTAIIAF